jgi:transcriptional regulator with XRE-family HTH domain
MKISKDCDRFLKGVGAKLRKIRHDRGWSLEDAEEKGYSSWRRLQQIESGRNITLATLWQLAELYDISPSELLKGL